MANKKNDFSDFVIVRNYGTDDQRFWSGSRWVSEYPDAQVYTREATARGAFWRAAERCARDGGDAYQVGDYGLETEFVARSTKSISG